MPTSISYEHTLVSLAEWQQAVTSTARLTLETAAGHPLALPADQWTATAETTDDGRLGRVCGPLATAYYQGCADPAHWPDADRLAAAIAGAPPIRGNWLKRTLHRLRMPRGFPPTAYLELPPPTAGTEHTVCWAICVIPSLVDLHIATDTTSKPRSRQPAMPRQ